MLAKRPRSAAVNRRSKLDDLAQGGRSTKPPARRSRVPEAKGSGWCARVARGLTRVRENKFHMSIPELCERYKIEQRTYYRMERATFPATTATRLDEVCEKLKVSVEDLLELGRLEV